MQIRNALIFKKNHQFDAKESNVELFSSDSMKTALSNAPSVLIITVLNPLADI